MTNSTGESQDGYREGYTTILKNWFTINKFFKLSKRILKEN